MTALVLAICAHAFMTLSLSDTTKRDTCRGIGLLLMLAAVITAVVG
jgi:hypothetical protein